MVIDGDGELLLGLLLPNDVLVEEGLHLLRLRQLVGDGSRRSCGAVVFKDGVADLHAFVADVRPGIVARRRDEFRDRVLRLVAKRTAQHLFGARSGFHSALLLFSGGLAAAGFLLQAEPRRAASLHCLTTLLHHLPIMNRRALYLVL